MKIYIRKENSDYTYNTDCFVVSEKSDWDKGYPIGTGPHMQELEEVLCDYFNYPIRPGIYNCDDVESPYCDDFSALVEDLKEEEGIIVLKSKNFVGEYKEGSEKTKLVKDARTYYYEYESEVMGLTTIAVTHKAYFEANKCLNDGESAEVVKLFKDAGMCETAESIYTIAKPLEEIKDYLEKKGYYLEKNAEFSKFLKS